MSERKPGITTVIIGPIDNQGSMEKLVHEYLAIHTEDEHVDWFCVQQALQVEALNELLNDNLYNSVKQIIVVGGIKLIGEITESLFSGRKIAFAN